MGERKGQNHYYPPDFDYKKHKSLNGYHGVHALRERGAKAHLGILIIRFEMPFNVWCTGCGNHIGMGVRYNAEKRKVGMYYTTPLYEFSMKCVYCPTKFIIRTDPKNFDYELVDGCRRQEKRFDSGELDNVAPVDRTESLRLDADAMYKMEHKKKDKDKQEDIKDTIDKLQWIQERMRDDAGANAALRNAFRAEKKHLAGVKISDDALKERLSISVPLVPSSEEDKIMARQMLLYKNLGSGKKCGPSTSDAVPAKKMIERKLIKRGPAVFDSKAVSDFERSRAKSARVMEGLIKPKVKSEVPESDAIGESHKLRDTNLPTPPEPSTLQKPERPNLVSYASDSD
uniref:Coiled-coil domain-containing protein 130 n=1 Tax=Panagrellus redivivus TaxID=6233 RepID=A0A7E4VBN0_PANRE